MTSQIESFFIDLSATTEIKSKIALLDAYGRTLTYQQLLNNIESAHVWLNSIGLKPGNTVIALLPNCIETTILFLASLRAGLIYAPLPCTATLSEITRWKKCARANFCLLANPVSHTLQTQIKELNWHVEMIHINEQENWPTNKKLGAEKTGMVLIPSSGSTGEPKAILLSGDRLWSSAKAFSHYHQIEKSLTRFWNYLPMSYLGGLFNLTIIPLAAGGSVFVDNAFDGKTFLNFWSVVERYHINSIWLVPSILRGLLTLSKRIGQNRLYPKMQHCFLGTAPSLTSEKEKFFEIFGMHPIENYGLSETTFISSEKINSINLYDRDGVGGIMPDVKIKLKPTHNDEKKEVKEIWVKTPFLMVGYASEEGVTDPILDNQGFMATGDFGQMLDGRLFITGRKRDIIKKGGVLILLREIEQTIGTYPQITEAVAVKIDHVFYGESFNLYICLANTVLDCALFQKEFTHWLHKQLTRDRWPEKILLCRKFPRTSTGKVQKHLLKMSDSINV